MRTKGEAKFKETRDLLRETTEEIVEKGKELLSHRCCSVDATSEAHQEGRRETLGG